uniref:Uncharacterized protein n=1 Tax=uncultured marine bacterium MedDCM-OCT-S01-C266 TaxID=743047 RepID=D6PCD6_9BACT|nr:hypothetical protein [uncultured marine bacterium MedDCM-OCT-S01-C266]
MVLARVDVGNTIYMDQLPSLGRRIDSLVYIMFLSTSGPKQINRDGYTFGLASFKALSAEIKLLVNHDSKTFQQQLASLGVLYTHYALPKVPIYYNFN